MMNLTKSRSVWRQGKGVAGPAPVYTSEFVKRTLAEVEDAIKTKRETSGVDRVHSALHGYLRLVCDRESIKYIQGDRIVDLFKLLAKHAALKDLGPRPQDTATITKSFCAVMTVMDPLRNKASYAHSYARATRRPRGDARHQRRADDPALRRR